MIRFLQFVLTVLCLALAMVSCSKPSDDPPELTNTEKLAAGWVDYEANRIYDARDMFHDVKSDELLRGEALSGLAWCYHFLGQRDSSKAYADLSSDAGHVSTDLSILMSALQLTDELFSEAIDNLGDITINSTWAFEHDPDVNYEDYALILGYSNYHLGNFAETIANIQLLDSSVNIDSEDSGTWNYLETDYSELGVLLLVVLNDFSGVLVSG
jgi:hypothetical protein